MSEKLPVEFIMVKNKSEIPENADQGNVYFCFEDKQIVVTRNNKDGTSENFETKTQATIDELGVGDITKYFNLEELDITRFASSNDLEEINKKIDKIADVESIDELDISKYPMNEEIKEFEFRLKDKVDINDLEVIDLSNIATKEELTLFNQNHANFVRETQLDELDMSMYPNAEEIKEFEFRLKDKANVSDLDVLDTSKFVLVDEYNALVSQIRTMNARITALEEVLNS